MTRGVAVIDEFDVQHDVVLHWDVVGGAVLERSCSCGERWVHEQDSCPVADPDHDMWDKHGGDVVRLAVDGTVTLSRVDGTIIGPSSIARPEAVEARRLLDEQGGGGRRG